VLSGGEVVRASVPNGMIWGGEVDLDLTGDLYVTLDGIEMIWTGAPLRENGKYEVFLAGRPENPVFTVTVAIGPVNFIDIFTAPNGYVIIEVGLEEGLVPVNEKSLALEDGHIIIIIEQDQDPSDGGERQRIYTSLEIDRTPPVLTFEGVNEDGNAYEMVTFTANEPVQIRIVRNSRPYAENIGILLEPGHYLIIVTDAAGNEVIYELRILYSMNASGWWMIVLFSAMLLALIVYLMRNRRNVRVR